jgi:hypothetical protein
MLTFFIFELFRNLTFLLTPDYGMKVVAECNQSGFHQHPNNPTVFEVNHLLTLRAL